MQGGIEVFLGMGVSLTPLAPTRHLSLNTRLEVEQRPAPPLPLASDARCRGPQGTLLVWWVGFGWVGFHQLGSVNRFL